MSENRKALEEYVAFCIGEQEFCIAMNLTRELRGWIPTTPLANSPDYILGVINLRGIILPVLDMAKRLGLSTCTPGERHVIIVVQFEGRSFGLLVEAVSDILKVSPNEVREVPDLNLQATENFFKQVIVQDDRIICEIELKQLLPELEMESQAA